MPSCSRIAHPAVDDRLLELGIGHAEAQQAAGSLIALIDGHRMPAAVELGRDGEPRRAGPDDRDRPPRAPVGRLGDDPALGVRALDDRQLDLLDRDRIVVDGQHASRLARSGTDQPGELGKVVGAVELIDRVAPLVAKHEVVPVGDQVAQRATFVAEGNPAIHAPRALTAQLGLGLEREVLLVVAHATRRITLVKADPMNLQKCAEFTHGSAKASNAHACPIRLRSWGLSLGAQR